MEFLLERSSGSRIFAFLLLSNRQLQFSAVKRPQNLSVLRETDLLPELS